MEAQSITPFKTGGAPRQDAPARNLSDAFQDLLRAREARFRHERDWQASRGLERDRGLDRALDRAADRALDRGLERALEQRETHELAWDRSQNLDDDAAHESQWDRVPAEGTCGADARETHGCKADQQPRAESADDKPEQEPVVEETPAVQETAAAEPDDSAQGGDTPAETEIVLSEIASNGETMATDAAVQTAASLDVAEASAEETVPTPRATPATEIATEPVKLAGKPNVEGQAATVVSDPAASKPGADAATRPNATPAPTGAGLATPATAGADPIATAPRPDLAASSVTAPAKTPTTPGTQAEGKSDFAKDGQLSSQAKLQPSDTEPGRTNRAAAERAEQTGPNGPKSAPAAQAKAQAIPGQQGEAVLAGRTNATPAVEAAGRRSQGANDLASTAPKAAGSASNAGPAQASLNGFDPTQGAVRTASGRTAAAPNLERPVSLNEVTVQIHRAAARGENRIRIQLHPAELGQIDVRLKVGADGIVRAAIHVERPETMDFMQRDARGLERALQDAGLKTDSGSLSFNLRDSGYGGPRDRDGQVPRGGYDTASSDHVPAVESVELPVQSGWSSRALDMRV